MTDQNRWQPIETATKDEEILLCWNSKKDPRVWYRRVGRWHGDHWKIYGVAGQGSAAQVPPQFWMPLLPAPGADGEPAQERKDG